MANRYIITYSYVSYLDHYHPDNHHLYHQFAETLEKAQATMYLAALSTSWYAISSRLFESKSKVGKNARYRELVGKVVSATGDASIDDEDDVTCLFEGREESFDVFVDALTLDEIKELYEMTIGAKMLKLSDGVFHFKSSVVDLHSSETVNRLEYH